RGLPLGRSRGAQARRPAVAVPHDPQGVRVRAHGSLLSRGSGASRAARSRRSPHDGGSDVASARCGSDEYRDAHSRRARAPGPWSASGHTGHTMTASASRRPFNLDRWPSVAHIGGALVGWVLAEWFGTMVYNFRVVGRAHAIGLAIGTLLIALWTLITVQRVLTASPPAWLRELLDDGEFVVGFVVLDLIVLNVFAPFFMPLALVWPSASILLLVLSFVGRVSAGVLFGIFAAVTTALAWLMVIRLARWLVPPSATTARLQRAFRVAAVSALALYGIYATVLSFNGSLGT